MTSKAKIEYPRSFKILRVIAWILLPFYLRYCGAYLLFSGFGFNLGMPMPLLMLITFVGLFIFVFITPVKRTLLNLGRGDPKKRIKAWIIWLTVLTMIFLHLFVCHKKKAKRLEGIFQTFIADPIPQSVEITGGDYGGFQTKTGRLVFKISQQSFQELAASYKLIPPDDLEYRDSFPRDVVNPVFYYHMPEHNDHYDKNFVIWDKDNLKCYVDIEPGCGSSEDDDNVRYLSSRWTGPSSKALDAFRKRKLERRLEILERLKRLSPEEILKDDPDITIREAVGMDKVELVKLMLQKNTDIDINKRDIFTWLTLLEIAIKNDNYEMTKSLIENGATVNGKSLYNMISGSNYNKEIIKLLLENGADNNTSTCHHIKLGSSEDITICATTLMHAVIEENIELVELLIEYGADVNALSEQPDYFPDSIEITALEIARKKGLARIEKILLQAGATQ